MQYSKLSLPRLAQGIARPRLFNELDSTQVAWIAAPAGAGKTTLAATYILERKFPYLWYQLDKEDSDPATFFYYLGIAIRQTIPNKEIFLPLLGHEYFGDIPGFASRYFSSLVLSIPTELVLVLDNYQDLDNDSCFCHILLSAIKAMPFRTRFLILSRELPPPIVTARLGSEIITLKWDEVRLTVEETHAIITQRYKVEEDKITAIHSLAGGWPAGITLLMEQFQHGINTGQSAGLGSMEMIFNFSPTSFSQN